LPTITLFRLILLHILRSPRLLLCVKLSNFCLGYVLPIVLTLATHLAVRHGCS
jgi:hypothetical protein